MHLGLETINIGQLRRSQPHDGRQRHAVHVAAGRGLGRVDVGMGVNPDQPDLLLLHAPLLAEKLGHPGHRPGRDGMVSAQHQRKFSRFQRLHHDLRVLGARGRDFFQVLGVRIARFLLLRDGDSKIAAVFHHMAQFFQARFKSGHAHGGRAHINTAA